MPRGKDIKIAIIGVGNCASSFIQGLHYYRKIEEHSPPVVGLMHNIFGGYRIRDIKVMAAFDVNARKVGKDIADAIWQEPNCTKKFSDVPKMGTRVSAAPILDGVAPHMRKRFPLVKKSPNVLEVVKKSGVQIIINYLPAGSEKTSQFWVETALKTGTAFINAIPVFIASDRKWVKRFEQKGLPCAGDDVKSQVGATILHRALVDLVLSRGQSVDETYQLDIGGNTDFENMHVAERYKTKRISKTESVAWQGKIGAIKIAAVDYVPHLKDNKIAYINVRGRQFGGIPFEIESKISVEDSPNSAGIMVDAVRAMKISLDRKLTGYQEWGAYFFKHPLRQLTDDEARKIVEEFLV